MARGHVAVIGAGIAGLAAAYRLSQRGFQVTLIERRRKPGGLARCIELGSGRIECYYHFICGGDRYLIKLAGELGLEIRWRPAPVGQWINGRLWPFSTALDLLRFAPLSLSGRLRMGLHAAKCQKMKSWQHLDRLTAKQWLLDTVGSEVYEKVWRPLLEIKFGPYHDRVSAAWLWHRIWRVGTSRRSALRPDIMGHIVGGSCALFDALIDRLSSAGAEVNLGCNAQALCRTPSGLTVRTDRGELSCDAVVLAIALPEAAKLLQPLDGDFAGQLSAVPYLAVLCGLVVLESPMADYFWVNINDPAIPFNGFIEYSNLNPSTGVWGGHIVYIPVYAPRDSEAFLAPDDLWRERFIQSLARINPAAGESAKQVTITRDIYAQPVCEPGFAARIPPIKTPVPGVYLLESTQLYPADRNLSGMIGLANRCAQLITGEA